MTNKWGTSHNQIGIDVHSSWDDNTILSSLQIVAKTDDNLSLWWKQSVT